MPKTGIARGISVATLMLVACSSTAEVGEIRGAGASPVEEVAAPQSLEPFAESSVAKRKRPGLSAMQETVAAAGNDMAGAAETAFVAGAPSSPTAPSPQAQRNARFGPGVSGKAIRLGVVVPEPIPEWGRLLYPETIAPDYKTVWRIVIEAINSTGGILGRKIEPVYVPEGPEEEICTHFTEEEHVIAVAGPLWHTSASCLDRAGIVPLVQAFTLESDFYRDAPHALTPLGISQFRLTPLYIEGLYQQGFFDGEPRIGLIRWDTPPYPDLTEQVVKPMLARYGLEIQEELVITSPQQTHQIANAQAEGRSGVQRFKRAGIDRVLTLDESSWILPEFTDYAEAQDYHPRYGLHSLNGGEWSMERNQLNGAMGIGWMPWRDLEPKDAYRHGSDGARRCHDLMTAAGEGRQMDTYYEALSVARICDHGLLLKAAVEAGAPSITQASIVAGAESLGTSFSSANTLSNRFEPGRHEGVAAIRYLRWFVRCQCFRYTSDLIDAG